MKNFPFEHDGQELWYSRSLACNAVIFRNNGDQVEVLACKRGNGCEFNKGLWNIPGGFIDFDEDSKQCAIRELKEETGVEIPYNQLMFVSLDTVPHGKRQTMVATHLGCFDYKVTEQWKFTTEYSEPGEVELIKWIDVHNLYDYKWAPGQIKNIEHALNVFLSNFLEL